MACPGSHSTESKGWRADRLDCTPAAAACAADCCQNEFGAGQGENWHAATTIPSLVATSIGGGG
eukprot:2709059-Amphidinium_carterae.1